MLDTARLERSRGVPPGAPLYSLLHRQATEQLRNYCSCWRLDPSLVEASVGVAKILLEEHETDEAIRQLQAITAGHPQSAEAHYSLMMAYRQQKKMPEAAEEMAIFNRLQTERSEKFQNKLNALLNAKPPAAKEDPK